jgi:hypothetical protein
VCDLETSRMGAPYIYDISRLRVNSIYVSIKKLCANVIKYQMILSV